MSETAKMELRRRLGVVLAIYDAVKPKFIEQLSLRKCIDDQESIGAKKKGLLALGLLIIGAILHYLFRESDSSFDFTFGVILMFGGGGLWMFHLFEIDYMKRQVKALVRDLQEYLYRWRANGGSEFNFFRLYNMLDDGHFGEDEYDLFYYEAQWNILSNILGIAILRYERPSRNELTGEWK